MGQVGGFFSGLAYAVQFVIRKGLFASFIPSIALGALFYFLFSGGQTVGNSVSFMENWWGIGWLVSSSKSLFGLLSFFIFEFFILVLLSPINSYFAEKVREDLTGETLGFSMAVFLKSLWRMIGIFFLAFFMQILLSILLWIFSFLLGDHFKEIASLLNVAFFIGFSFFDFGLELNEVSTRNSWRYARKNWMACIIIGLAFNFGVYYPQKHDLILVYAIAIAILPHLLAIAASHMYFNGAQTSPQKPDVT